MSSWDPKRVVFPGLHQVRVGNLTLYTDTQLNEGSFSRILTGKYLHHKEVAVKLPYLHLLKSARSEINMLSKLDHPSIVPLLGIEELEVVNGEEPVPLLIMPRFRHSLWTLMVEFREGKNNVPCCLPQDVMDKFMYDMLEAIAYLHTQGISHSDVKPENVLTDDGKDFVLADFNSAYSDKEHKGVGTYRQSRYYRSPENILECECADKVQDLREDEWSLACVVGELVLGVPLFVGAMEDTRHLLRIEDYIGTPLPARMLETAAVSEEFCPLPLRRSVIHRKAFQCSRRSILARAKKAYPAIEPRIMAVLDGFLRYEDRESAADILRVFYTEEDKADTMEVETT